MSIVEQATEFVKGVLQGNDASHDWAHIERVYKMATNLANKEGITDKDSKEVIALGAIMHDVHDYKYSGSETAGAEAVDKFLSEHNYPNDKKQRVLHIINNISYSKELEKGNVVGEDDLELKIVQDADRLDAIGAIGVARTMIYSGAKGRPMYDPNIKPNLNPSKQEYQNKKNDTAINHFYEKLLKLKDIMKTKSGKEVAQKRHEFMELYLDQFLKEWEADL
jgi:uncharacterized protein